MIKVIIELWPHGSQINKKVIASAYITNDGTGTRTRGNYNVVFAGKTKRSIKGVTVRDFPRRSYNVWKLLYKALKELFG